VHAQPVAGIEQSGASEPPLDVTPDAPLVVEVIFVPVEALEPPPPTTLTVEPPAHVIEPAIKESENRVTAWDRNRIAASKKARW
jgi:hypothetical protein